ncbi:MAG TPA: alkaline phosphatase family protein [Bacillales bacterium]|nr:alkaline phosphatase family protein [Bacillales bacterium]
MNFKWKKSTLALAGGFIAVSTLLGTSLSTFAKQNDPHHHQTDHSGREQQATKTPIKHLVVIFDENVSFDHYFGTYPHAKNPDGEPQFHAAPGTPSVNGLNDALLHHNPNKANPQRLDRSQAVTPDMDHGYTEEQKAFDGGLMDKFVEYTGNGHSSMVMNYYDGNTVTALWNYAQHFAMSDNSFNTTFGPSTPGALNLISGQTHGAEVYSANVTQDGKQLLPGDPGFPTWAINENDTVYSDPNPYYDMASDGPTVKMTGKNVGDLLNAKNVTWGWFQGGFRDPKATHQNIAGKTVTDYIPHHEPFQYYESTSNPKHLPPSSVAMIGHTDQANHQYDLKDFWKAADAGNLPAVSFLKAAGYQDGHAGYSDPLDEQHFLVKTINRLQKLKSWKSTAVIIAYDESDGWYDHVMGPIVNGSNDPKKDALIGPGNAGEPRLGPYKDRAGYGPRLPLLVISPYAKVNFVDHTVTDQTSILRFIEDNWQLGRIGDYSFDSVAGSLKNMFNFQKHPHHHKLFLDPKTGEAKHNGHHEEQD